MAYPAPVTLADLVKDLSEQGYSLKGKSAVFEDSDFACRYVRTITWRTIGDQADRIAGFYEFACV